MPNRSKRPSAGSGGGGGRANINLGGLAGAMADSGNPATTAQPAGDYGSLDASGNATAPTATTASPAISQFAKPTIWQQMLSTPGASAYYQQQMQQSAAAQALANQQALSLYNAQTVDPILQGNQTTALGARAPIDVQKANAQKYGIDYNDWTTARPQALTTFSSSMDAEQAQNQAAQQAGINSRIKGEGYQQFARGIGANTGSGEEFTTALGAEKAQAGLQDFSATRPAMSQFAIQDANNQLQQSQMLGRSMTNQANMLPLTQTLGKLQLGNQIKQASSPWSSAIPLTAPAYAPSGLGDPQINPGMFPRSMTEGDIMLDKMKKMGVPLPNAGNTTATPTSNSRTKMDEYGNTWILQQ